MNLPKITQDDFNNFPITDGKKQCPTGDYSAIKIFSECSFGEGCSFGKECSFGGRCSLGRGCSFGEMCSFGEICSFGERCSAPDPIWNFPSTPPFEVKGRILSTNMEHWAERLEKFGIDIIGNCYEEILEKVKPKKNEILMWDGWLKWELNLIRSWLKSEAEQAQDQAKAEQEQG